MVSINIQANVKPVLKELDFFFKNQVPYAMNNSLNKMAFEAQQEVKKTAEHKLDRPIGFTLRGFRFRRSNKRTLTSVVYIQPIQADYLKYQITGGTRIPKRGHTAVPRAIKLNDYGNIRGRKSGIIKNNKQFIATINNLYGIWERPSNAQRRGKNKTQHDKIKLLARIMTQVEYEKRFPYFETVQLLVDKRFTSIFRKQLAEAIKTAR